MSKPNQAFPFEKDEWEAWRENPLTVWFFDHFVKQASSDAKQTFVDHAWGRRDVDPIYHAALFERAKVLNEMREMSYEDF